MAYVYQVLSSASFVGTIALDEKAFPAYSVLTLLPIHQRFSAYHTSIVIWFIDWEYSIKPELYEFVIPSSSTEQVSNEIDPLNWGAGIPSSRNTSFNDRRI